MGRNLAILSQINKDGKKILILKRTETVDSETGHVEYTYDSTIETRAIINEVGGLLLPWLEFGLRIEGDLQLIIKPDIEVEIGDMIILTNKDKYEITNPIKCPPIDSDFIEVLCKRV